MWPRFARCVGLSLLVLFFARPVLAQQLVSQQILQPPTWSHPWRSLCVWTLPPCAEDGTCRAHAFVAASPTATSSVRMEVRVGRRPSSPKREGYWHIWGYIIDGTGKQYNTALFLETSDPCLSIKIGPTGAPDTARIIVQTQDARFQTQRIVKGIGTRSYTAHRVGVWVEGSEPPPEDDVHVEASYYTEKTTLGVLREVGLERGEPVYEDGPGAGDVTHIPFLSPGPQGNS